MRYLVFLLMVTIISCSNPDITEVYKVADYGAVPNDGKIDSEAFNRAIAQCNLNGGGTVMVPPGNFIVGTIYMKSDVELHISHGAVVNGSTSLEDYDRSQSRGGMIFGRNLKNIALSGSGILNGNCMAFHDPGKMHIAGDLERNYTRQGENYLKEGDFFEDGPIAKGERPGMMVVFLDCSNVSVKDLNFRDSPTWTIRIGDCDNVRIEGVSIMNNLLIPNSDGIHFTNSRNITVSNCDIRAGDDALIFTGFSDEINVDGELEGEPVEEEFGNFAEVTENVTVSNCLLQSRSSGIRIGYGQHGIRNLSFSNIIIYGSNRGIGIFNRDTSTIENLFFSDIIIQTRLHSGHWWGNGEPIHISAISRHENQEAGRISNIRFTNVNADSETGMVIWGFEKDQIRNVEFQNISFILHSSPLSNEYGGNFDLRPVADHSFAIFRHDIPGLYAQNTRGLHFENFKLSWEGEFESFYTHGLETRNVTDLYIDKISRFPASPGAPVQRDMNMINTRLLQP